MPCHVPGPHRTKQCEFYHADIDRRRTNRVYSAMICKASLQKKCLRGENCEQAHSDVERLYHVEKYKTKFCLSSVQECSYIEYCSFAHTELDLKTRLIHKYERNADFYMYYFKTEWCPF
mmetsp:Transcript_44598/g.59176  ORF Transcript_44598/g.59176 Transcript_44598/m.59176 type:complete len:119 (-) Transcript_44598:65-421(-)